MIKDSDKWNYTIRDEFSSDITCYDIRFHESPVCSLQVSLNQLSHGDHLEGT